MTRFAVPRRSPFAALFMSASAWSWLLVADPYKIIEQKITEMKTASFTGVRKTVGTGTSQEY